MTDNEKASFFDSLKAPEKREPSASQSPEPAVDFSFFDEARPSAPPESREFAGKPDLDFSFFDEPASTQQPESQSTVSPAATPGEPSAFLVEQNTADNAFSFLDAAIPPTPAESPEADRGDGALFNFNGVAPEEVVSPVEAASVERETAGQGPRVMGFTCLKCSAMIPFPFPAVPCDRSVGTCPNCSAPFSVIRESSAQRARRKSGELYCCTCGNAIDQHVHCPACGHFCPDYYHVENPQEAQRKARESRANSFRIALANFRSSAFRQRDKRAEELHQAQRMRGAAKAGAAHSGRKRLVIVVVAAVLLAVIGGGALLAYRHKQEQRYVAAYIKAVYALHIGTETCFTSLNKMVAEWKAASENGRAYTPRGDNDAGIRLVKINSEATKLLQQLQEGVPVKYEKAHENLQELNREYVALQPLVTAPPQSFEQINRRVETADKAVKRKVQELKAGLNEDMSRELDEARKRYRGLANF